LDDLPWPERGDVPMYNYNDGFAGLPTPNVQMWASRGCPFSCTFCLWPQTIYGERRHRKRNPRDVIDEMEYLVKNFDFKAVYFDDDIFNADRHYVAALCGEIKKRRLTVPWAVMARPDLMDGEIIRVMADAGLCAIKYGIESTDTAILQHCRKNLNLAKAKSMIQETMLAGVKTHLTFCLGLPGETLRTVQETRRFIREMKPDSYQVSIATPFPGTAYFRQAEENNWLRSGDFSDYDGRHKSMARTESLSWQDIERIAIDLDSYLNA
jgi:radical SAM superfamily enzyme YgiQ (UPF0313 family)